MMGLDDFFALEHTDANAFLLGGSERLKKRELNELGSHAATVVAN